MHMHGLAFDCYALEIWAYYKTRFYFTIFAILIDLELFITTLVA